MQSDLSYAVIGCAIRVHRALGPGLLESAYSACLAHELALEHLRFEREKSLPLCYRGTKIDAGFRLDFVIEETLVVEVKAVDVLLPLHVAQLLTYLKLSRLPLGLLVNFNVRVLKDGVRRLAGASALQRRERIHVNA